MNHRRQSPWTPDWRYDRFLLGCYHTAINIPNGRGKSTMILMLLSMIAGQTRTLTELMRTHSAPESSGAYTHLRIEITHRVPRHDDLLHSLVGPSDGERMVFGLFGNVTEGRPFSLYAYRGTFDDCPLATEDGPNLRLTSRDAFLECLERQDSVFPKKPKHYRDEEWRRFTADHFDMASIKQQYAYQMANAAEGSSTYFDVAVPKTGNYSAELFYKRLAPELLVDVMGNHSEENERGIEDTIHEKASSVVLARKRTRDASQELKEASHVLERFVELDEVVQQIDTARAELEATQRPLAEEFAILEHAVLISPFPGSPRAPAADAPNLYLYMVLQRGDWWITDQGISYLLGETVGHVNQRALRAHIGRTGANKIQKTQVIEIYCDLKKNLTAAGHPRNLYSHEEALRLCSEAADTNPGRDREQLFLQLNAAFAWARYEADTNPARQAIRKASRGLSALADERKLLDAESGELQERVAELRREEALLKEGGSAWEMLKNSGCFTEQELNDPEQTGMTVRQEAASANYAFDAHNEAMSKRNAIYLTWKDFCAEFGDQTSPGGLAKDLEQQLKQADLDAHQLRQTRSTEKALLDKANAEHKLSRSVLEELRQRHSVVLAHQGNAEGFALRFFGEEAEGLELKVTEQLQSAKQVLDACKREVTSISNAVQSVEIFTAQYPEITPAEWLKTRNAQREELSTKQAFGQRAIAGLELILEGLEQNWLPASTFEQHFLGESTEGLEASVQSALQKAKGELRFHEHTLQGIQSDLLAIDRFNQRFPGVQPDGWLLEREIQRSEANEVRDKCTQSLQALVSQEQLATAKRVQAEAFDRYFPNECPTGLASRVTTDWELAKQQKNSYESELKLIQRDLDAVEHFRARVPELLPTEWTRQWQEALTNAQFERTRLQDELECKVEERRLLDRDPIVASPNARAALDIAGQNAQPLYAAIDTLGLSDSKKEAVLSLFSALLFAPVLRDEAEAIEIAYRLAEAKIEVPVFVHQPLSEFCHDRTITYRDGVAEGLFVGVRTWPVACLLDPSLIEQERSRLDAQIIQLRAEVETQQAILDGLEADRVFARIATHAQGALEHGVPELGSKLKSQIELIDQDLPRLAERASSTAKETIEARIAFADALGLPPDSNWAPLQVALSTLQSTIDELSSKIRDAEEKLLALARDEDEEANATQAAAAIRAGKPEEAQALRESIIQLEAALPGLEDRANATALLTIRAMTRLQESLGLSPQDSWIAVTEARAAKEEELAALHEELNAVKESFDDLAKSSSMEGVALAAASAISAGLPERHAFLVDQIAELDSELVHLEDRASPSALVSIRAMCTIEQQLQGVSLGELGAQVSSAIKKEGQLSEEVARLGACLEELNEKIARSQEKLSEAYDRAKRVDQLNEVQAFLDDPMYGPVFMHDAPAQQTALRSARDNANRRAAFEFEGAVQYVRSGGSARITLVREELEKGENRRGQIDSALQNILERQDQLNKEIDPLRQTAQMIDDAVIRIRHAYVERKKNQVEPVEVSAEQLHSNPLYISLNSEVDSSPEDISHALVDACVILDSDEAEELQQRFKIAGQDLKRHTDQFHKLIEKVLNDPYLKIPEIARTQLQQARMSPAIVTGMLQATQKSYAESLEANNIADKHLTEAREGLSDWLANFTLRLPDNLKTMRQIFAPKHDPVSRVVTRAGFIIDAKTIDSDGVRSLIETIISDVEAYESSEQAQHSSLREALRRDLRANIRENFYRKVIVSPRIRLVLPAISSVPLEMDRKMASTGQGIAITFLWILRLAEFVSEREVRRETVGAAQRRRLRDKATSFTIVDGAFSHLSEKNLIDETLQGIEDSTGRFQLIVTVHDPAYQNDFNRFPSLVVAREMRGHYMRSWSHLNEIGEKDALGRDSLATFQTIQVRRPPDVPRATTNEH
ncbi:hypothetical protein ACV3YV_27055 [Pseudomonas aeruginosa]